MENIQEENNPFTYNAVMENIGFWIEDFENNPANRVEDIKTESQSVWNACLLWVHDNYIKPNSYYLKDHTLKNIGARYPTNNGQYNIDTLLIICNVYLYYCSVFDKIPSIFNYSSLTGITKDNISMYRTLYNKKDELNSKRYLLYKNLIDTKEELLAGRLETGKQNPVGLLAVLNHKYKWNENGTYLPHNSRAGTLEELPVFSLPTADTVPELSDNNPENETGKQPGTSEK